MTIDDFVTTIAEELEIDVDLTPETVFMELPSWSSLSIMELIVIIDRDFHKSLTWEEVAECGTIGALYDKASA